MKVLLPAFSALLLCGCGTTAYWQGADGSKGAIRVDAEVNLLTQESYNGRGGLFGMFGGSRSGDGDLARSREIIQQPNGDAFALHVGPDGISFTGTSLSHATPTRATGAAITDYASNLKALAVGETFIKEGADVIKSGLDTTEAIATE